MPSFSVEAHSCREVSTRPSLLPRPLWFSEGGASVFSTLTLQSLIRRSGGAVSTLLVLLQAGAVS